MPLQRSQRTPEPEEATPLLCDRNPLQKNTPLPITQILVLLMLQLTEPITSLSINPYINQLVSELPVVGGDERKIGYYAGLIMSIRLSDKVGRKPVLLCGLLGTIVSSLLFVRLNGMLNGNTGVIKSMMAELTDETNMARGLSLIPVTWAICGTLGPFIGGVLSRPQDHPSRLGEGQILDGPAEDIERPPPLRALLTRPVVVSVANYCVMGLLDIAAKTLIPLVWSTSVEFGGLNMSPASIGLWISGYGFANGIFQTFNSVLCHFPFYTMFPLENLTIHHSGRSLRMVAGLLITLQLTRTSFSAMGFGVIFMYISTAAPDKRSLAAAASLFALSLENNILGGNFVYIVMLGVVCVGLGIAMQLPKNTWKHK
ncbi:Major facilitator superfamily domain containing protein [Lactarius tabidus]